MKPIMATVVTAFYIMDSKFPSQQYMKWIRNFLANVDCYLVFYTDADLIPILEEMREPYKDKTRFIALPREEWTAYTKYGKTFWTSQKNIDREAKIHSADLYAIWYEKKEFVLRAAKLNPFGHTNYIWCDAGAFRYDQWLPSIRSFGNAIDDIVDNKITLLQVEEFTEKDRELFASDKLGKFEFVNRIGGGIQAAAATTWAKWSALYDNKLQEYVATNKFVGKDQSIMAALVLENSDLVNMITANREIESHWFTLLFTFSVIKPHIDILIPLYNGIELLQETIDSVMKQTYKKWIIHIGVNGWEADSIVYRSACKQFASENIYIYDLPECKGKSATLNSLVTKTKGEWIALLDADDIWHPEKLEIQVEFAQKKREYDVIGTGAQYFGDRGGSPAIPVGDITHEDFWRINPLLHSSVLMRRNNAAWNPENRILEDYELWLRLRYQKKLKMFNIPFPLLFHRIHAASHFNGQNARAVPDLLNRLRNEFKSDE